MHFAKENPRGGYHPPICLEDFCRKLERLIKVGKVYVRVETKRNDGV